MKIFFFILILKDPISSFSRYLENSEDKNLFRIWDKRIKITPSHLEHNVKINLKREYVFHNPDLAKKYLGKFVSCSKQEGHINLLNDLEIKIIGKINQLFNSL